MPRKPKAPRICILGGMILAATFHTTTLLAHETKTDERSSEVFKPGVEHTVPAIGAAADHPPLYEGLGSMTMKVTTRSNMAQAYFNQGLVLTWAFNHAEARRAFVAAQSYDPDCALCYWGEAFVLGPNINDGMHDDAIAPAALAIGRAVSLKDQVSAKEKDLIEALAQRYDVDPAADREVLNAAWAGALRGVAKRHPGDANVLVFFADALMNLQPWDYWEADGVTPKGHGREIAVTLKEALEIDPDNPAAAHLFIHAVEASAHPEDAEAVADRLRDSVPAAGHLAHMPAHIYTRIGRYKDSMEVNRDAIAADEAFLAQAGTQASALYRYGYYPHNVHFLMTSAQMAGVAEDVFATAEKLAAVTSDDVAQDRAWVQAIKTAPYSAHAQFSAPDTILALPDPGSRFPFVKGFWHYARGVALAARGDVEPAWREAKAIEAIIADADLTALEAQYLPARDVLRIAKHLVEARVERSRKDYAAAAHHAMAAVALQDSLPYMEPPYWYYPARQTLGAIQLQQGQADAAVKTFNEALAETPRNGWALWGLLQAQLAADQNPVATRAALEKAWLGSDDLLTLDRL